MIDSKENIDNFIGRFLIIISFFFMLSLTSNDSGLKSDCQNISFEQVVDFNNKATLIKPVCLPDYNYSSENCIRFYTESLNNKYDIAIYNKIVNQQFKTEESRFYEFMPNLLRLQLSYLQFISAEDYFLIS